MTIAPARLDPDATERANGSGTAFVDPTGVDGHDLPAVDGVHLPAAQAAAAQADAVVDDDPSRAERVGWTLATLGVIVWALQLWDGSALYTWLNPVSCLMILAGLVATAAVWSGGPKVFDVVRPATVALWSVGFAGFWFVRLGGDPSYGTDALAFNQYAAGLLIKGINPYTTSLAPAIHQFLVPESYHTWMLDGSQVSSLSYPALSFLVYVPAMLLGAGMQTAAVVNGLGWLASVLLLWRLLPRRFAWAAPVVGSLSIFISFASGGVTDMVFLPFLIVALWRWDRYADADTVGPARWIGPIALGLAMCIKQTPWFVLPFVLIGLAFEARARGAPRWWRLPLRYLAVVGLVFVAVNLPFFVWAPTAFVHGMLLPLVDPTAPAGQGLITLAIYHHLGGPLGPFRLAGLAVIPVVLLAFTAKYDRLKPALPVLATVVFFWPTRSLSSYLVDLLPAALVAGTTVRPVMSASLGRWRRPLMLALAAFSVLFACAVTGALTSRQPLSLRVTAMQSTGEQQSVRELTVRVKNRGSGIARPVFAVIKGHYVTRPWQRVSGPGEIPPGHTADITLRAPDQQAMPGLQGGWMVTAFQQRPDAMSTSRSVRASTDRLTWNPSTVSEAQPIGRALHLAIQLRSQLGSAVHRAGVPISLGQAVYTNDGILAGETQINGSPVGQSPVSAVTDASGVAHFTVVGVTAQSAPVFLQAWIAPPGGVPHSYSEPMSVQFTESRAELKGGTR